LSGVTVVTLYDTLGKDSLEYILDQTYIKTCVLSADKLKNLVELKKEGKIPLLTHVIYFDEVKPADVEAAQQNGLTLVSYATVLEKGAALETKPEFDEVHYDTFYTFSYTSGTTGMPKGVMLTHRNFVANVGGMEGFDGEFTIRDDDVYISYLPLAHVFERVLLMCAMGYKMQYGFFGGDVLKLKEDLAVLRPTIMASVPRLYNRFYDVMQ
jgi:long-chain acyl-CoA synthetase